MPKYKLSAEERAREKARKESLRDLMGSLEVKPFKDIEEKIISMYAKGMSQNDKHM